MNTTNRCRSAPVVRLVGLDDAAVAGAHGTATGTAPAAWSAARGIAPVAALTSGLVCQLAAAAPGDLDPAFGNVGRAHPLADLWGPAWSVEAQGDAYLFAGGGGSYCDYDFYHYDCGLNDFNGRLTSGGSIDADFAAAELAETEVFDMAVQPWDGRPVSVGRSSLDGTMHLTVFRLNPDGSLDTSFGDGGIVRTDAAGTDIAAQSIVVESDEKRITVAGADGARLAVLRFLSTGDLDPAFATGGVFAQSVANSSGAPARIVRTVDGGGYRVTVHGARTVVDPSGAGCSVLALTTSGAVDPAFGMAGSAGVAGSGDGPVTCSSIATQADGRLLLAGSEGEQGFATRLLANGAPDATFLGTTVSDLMAAATALAVVSDGSSIVVAGHDRAGLPGSLVVRLLADGSLDPSFGTAGSTWLDLASESGSDAEVRDVDVLPGGGLLLAGSEYRDTGQPFVARMLGDGVGGGPGVLGVSTAGVDVAEQDGRAVVKVRRVGGSTGAVSVGYTTRGTIGDGWAVNGLDFSPVQGTLEWPDGDTGEREIVVPISADGASIEGPERFDVVLSNPAGSAGLGSPKAQVVIRGDGYPSGLLTIEPQLMQVEEGKGSIAVMVRRDFYATGRVSVTVRVADGTATLDEDYAGPAGGTTGELILTWEEGDMSPRPVRVVSLADKRNEPDETFSVSLTSPTGGAILGPQPTVTAAIIDNDKSGGGGIGGLGALLLGVAGWLRQARRRAKADLP